MWALLKQIQDNLVEAEPGSKQICRLIASLPCKNAKVIRGMQAASICFCCWGSFCWEELESTKVKPTLGLAPTIWGQAEFEARFRRIDGDGSGLAGSLRNSTFFFFSGVRLALLFLDSAAWLDSIEVGGYLPLRYQKRLRARIPNLPIGIR